MKPLAVLIATLACLGGSVAAEPDLERGEREFGRCLSCHRIADGDTVLRRGGRTGPNLFNLIGRPAAAEPGFAYADGLKLAASKGLVWDEANLAEFLADPAAFLKTFTGEAVRSKMTFKMKGGEHVAAYLAQLQAQN